jgi:hypothetical protein
MRLIVFMLALLAGGGPAAAQSWKERLLFSAPPLKYLNRRLYVRCVRDRAACHGCTGSGDGANDVGPPGEILGGFSFCADTLMTAG